MANNPKGFDYVNEIWNIADYVRDVIRPADYNKLILPFAVLRRFECALEPTREAVSNMAKRGVWDDDDPKYCALSKHCFYNLTDFRLNNLGASNTLEALMGYVNGFSTNAREVLQKFKMEGTCKDLFDKGMLYEVCTRFASFDLSPEAVNDREMSDIYEHLIQRYGEEISQDAEDFMTPKDVVRLATTLLFAGEDEFLKSDDGEIRKLYDGTCGTCGFLADALDQLDEWHDKGQFSSPAKIIPYGQESEDATWAMGKSAMMLRNIASGSGDAFDQMSDLSRYIRQGDTLDNDQFPHEKFNYQLTNPPYGKKWEKEKAGVLDEAALGEGGRFFAGVPFVSDGAMLFMQNVVSKMAPVEEGGGKAAIVLSGSPLFNGQAGSGPSSIRRWFFERDVVECIVKLPTNIFFRTGIATYIWIFNNHKDECRRHKIQLIDASECKSPLRKSLGNKRFEVSEEGIDWITKVYVDGHDHGKSVIVDDKEFMYRAVATKRPMRVEIIPNPEKTDALFSFSKPMAALDDDSRELLREWVQAKADSGSGLTYAEAEADCTKLTRKLDTVNHRGKPGKQKILDALVTVFGVKGEDKPLAVTTKGETIYDPDLADIENVPWGMDVDEYMSKEVLPFVPDAEVDESVVDSKGNLADGEIGQVGTSISFNRYFYEYEQPRDPNEIAEEILELETSLGDELKELLQP